MPSVVVSSLAKAKKSVTIKKKHWTAEHEWRAVIHVNVGVHKHSFVAIHVNIASGMLPFSRHITFTRNAQHRRYAMFVILVNAAPVERGQCGTLPLALPPPNQSRSAHSPCMHTSVCPSDRTSDRFIGSSSSGGGVCPAIHADIVQIFYADTSTSVS